MQSRAHAAETALLETQEELKKHRRSVCMETDEHAQVLSRCDEYREKLKVAQQKCDRLTQANNELERRVSSVENLRGLSKESWEAMSAERDSVAAQLSCAQAQVDELTQEAQQARDALLNEEQERRTLEQALEQTTALAEAAMAQMEEAKKAQQQGGVVIHEEEEAKGNAGGRVVDGDDANNIDLAVAGVSGGEPVPPATNVATAAAGDKLEVRMSTNRGARRGRRCLVPVVALTLFLAVATTLQQTILASGGEMRMVPT
jgi:hypothetical protein